MTITQLAYLLALAEHKSFTVAAEKCNITQPTMSMQLQKLEESLGVQIFDRTKKSVEITEVGKRIVEQAKKILYESKKIQDIVDIQKGYIGGDFRLGIIPTVMPTLLPMFISAFIQKYPKVNLIIEELTTIEIIQKLKNRHLDAGILATPLEEEAIQERILYHEPFVGYVHLSHILYRKDRINPEDININELLLLQDGHCFTDSVRNFCKNKNNQNRTFFELKSGSFETLVRLVDQGLGITLLPYLHTLTISDKNKLKHFEKPEPSREISLVHTKNELKTQIIDVLYQTISEIVKIAINFQDVKIISPMAR